MSGLDGILGLQNLEGDLFLDALLDCAVDVAHPPFTELAKHAVTPGHELPDQWISPHRDRTASVGRSVDRRRPLFTDERDGTVTDARFCGRLRFVRSARRKRARFDQTGAVVRAEGVFGRGR